MPIQFRYNADSNVLHVQSVGPVSLKDLSWYRDEVSKLPLKPGLRCLSDLTASKLMFSKEDLVQSNEHCCSPLATLGGSRMVMCVSDENDRQIIEAYVSSNSNEDFDARVCCSINEARDILGID